VDTINVAEIVRHGLFGVLSWR